MTYPVHETTDCAVGSFVSGDAGFAKELPRCPRGVLAEPSSNDIAIAQHGGSRGGYHLYYRTGGLFGLRQRGGAVEHQNGIDLRVADQRYQRIGIALPRRVADDVDRIAVAPC